MDDEKLKYKFLNNFDRSMNNLEKKYGWLSDNPVSFYYCNFTEFYLQNMMFEIVGLRKFKTRGR